MASIKFLNASGHTTLEYDLDTGVGVNEAQKALEVAVHDTNASAFDASTRERVEGTLGTAEEMIVVPQMAGGQ